MEYLGKPQKRIRIIPVFRKVRIQDDGTGYLFIIPFLIIEKTRRQFFLQDEWLRHFLVFLIDRNNEIEEIGKTHNHYPPCLPKFLCYSLFIRTASFELTHLFTRYFFLKIYFITATVFLVNIRMIVIPLRTSLR